MKLTLTCFLSEQLLLLEGRLIHTSNEDGRREFSLRKAALNV